MKLGYLFSGIYFLLLLANVAANIWFASLEVFVKPLLMIILLVGYVKKSKERNTVFILALLGALMGDVFLLSPVQTAFIAGLLCFLLTHLCYAKVIRDKMDSIRPSQLFISALPFLLLLTVVIIYVFEGLGDLLAPVLLYGLAIGLMGGLSLLYYRNYRTFTAALVLVGAIAFALSDSVLAIHRFQYQHPSFPALIIGSYALAQWLFVEFMLKSERTMPTE